MKIRDGGATILIILAIAAAIGVGSRFLHGQDDGPIEEAAENIIKQHTGFDVDLSPGSPEDE